MPMDEPSESDPGAKSGKARDDTDAKLRAERIKTDSQLERSHTSVEEDADRVVELARDRAGTTLRTERERSDRDMNEAGAPSEVRTEVSVERAAEDGAIAREHASADQRLNLERKEHRRALSALLGLERDATDDGLLAERARADEALATRDEFMGTVSHDLANMLGGIALIAEMLASHAKTEGDGVTMRYAERVQRFIARMNRLVSDLLDVVSLEAGKLDITRHSLHAADLIQETVEAFQLSFSTKGITLSSEIASRSILVDCDRERILQVLANLLSNALKFSDAGTNVALSVTRAGPEVCFSVTDAGAGIPAHMVESVFERFRQVDPQDRRGRGLGLYIAKSIVEAHGGRIWAERPAAGGTVVQFTLPAG